MRKTTESATDVCAYRRDPTHGGLSADEHACSVTIVKVYFGIMFTNAFLENIVDKEYILEVDGLWLLHPRDVVHDIVWERLMPEDM